MKKKTIFGPIKNSKFIESKIKSQQTRLVSCNISRYINVSILTLTTAPSLRWKKHFIGYLTYRSDLYKYGWRPFAYMLPVHGDGFVEKFQSLDFVQASQSFVCIATKLFNGSFGAFGYGHLWWKNKGVFPKHDLLVSLSGVLRAERWVSDQHFKHNHTKGPPVTG